MEFPIVNALALKENKTPINKSGGGQRGENQPARKNNTTSRAKDKLRKFHNQWVGGVERPLGKRAKSIRMAKERRSLQTGARTLKKSGDTPTKKGKRDTADTKGKTQKLGKKLLFCEEVRSMPTVMRFRTMEGGVTRMGGDVKRVYLRN